MTRLQIASSVRRHRVDTATGDVLARVVVAAGVVSLLWPLVAGMVGR